VSAVRATRGRAVAAIALNELRRAAIDRTALFFALALPVIIIVIIGSTFGGTPSLEIGTIDRDHSDPSASLVEALDRAEGVSVERYDSLDSLRRDVRTGAVAAGVVIPSGYGDRVDSTDERTTATVDLVSDPTSNSVAAVRTTVEGAVADEAVRAAAARFAAGHGGGDAAQARATADRLSADLPTAGVRSVDVEGDGTDDGDEPNRFSYTAPANLVLFVFINTMVVGAMLANDRKRGIVDRLLVTPHGTGTILAGIGAAKLVFALVQSALIVTIGALLFGVSWGDPIGAALLVVVFAAVSTAVGLLVGSIVSDAEQAQAIGSPIAIGMGMLGGCMWPLDIVPSAMRTIGHVVPHAWAMDAWIGLVFDGDSVAGIVPQLAVLAGFAVVLGWAAARRLRSAITSY
jgi:linearmycin/streptolysin S transport system permease protein